MENSETLALRAAKGDKAAFEQIYRDTYRSVYFTCISFIKNEADAKDMVQDTYLTAFEKLESLDDKSKLASWLNRIAVNKCRDYLKKKTPDFLDEETLENLPCEENESFLPEEYITDREKRRIVMKIMREVLSDVQYQTVIMYYFDEMTAAEIAGIMNCPVGTVTYRLSVARARIKEGVLDYENENNEKLHAIVGIPFLTRLLKAEAESLDIPPISPDMFANRKSPVNNAAKSAENGAKKMFDTLKSKVIAGVVAAAVVGGGITAGVMLSSNSDNSDDDIEPDVSVSSNDKISNDESSKSDLPSDVSDKDESSEAEPEYTGTRLWIDDIDLSNPITEQPDMKIGDMLGGTLDLPLTTEQLDERYSFYYFSGGKKYCSTIEEALAEGGVDERSHSFSIYCKPKTGDDGNGYEIEAMNYSDDENVTHEDCYYNNWWRIAEEYSYKYKEILDPDGVVEDDDAKALLENFMKTAGSPNYFSTVTSSFDDFEATRHDDNSLHAYYLGWVYDDYVILVSLHDGIYYGKNSLLISYVEYMPIEWWNLQQNGPLSSGSLDFSHNDIERLAESNGTTVSNVAGKKQ